MTRNTFMQDPIPQALPDEREASCCASCQYAPSSFNEVWSAVKSDPYPTLPNQRVTLGRFFRLFQERLGAAAKDGPGVIRATCFHASTS